MATGKLIAVAGPPGSGKTALAVKLAQEVHERTKAKVIYVSPDTTIPAMSFIFPRRKKEDLYSIGAALEKVSLSITDMLGVIATTTAMPNLGYMGYISGEGRHSYATLQESKVVSMYEILKDNFDYIFVDCDRDREDLISSLGCGLCDYLLQVINPDIKSIAYYGFEAVREDAIQVLNLLDNDVYLPIQDIKTHFPNIQHTIFYCRALKMQMFQGELMDRLDDPVYRKAIKPIVDRIIKEEPPVAEEEIPAEEIPADETITAPDEVAPAVTASEGEGDRL